MLEFEHFSLTALKAALPYLKNAPSICSDLSAGYLYMWHEDADVRFCIWNDTFAVKKSCTNAARRMITTKSNGGSGML